jgi:hypothetical protein
MRVNFKCITEAWLDVIKTKSAIVEVFVNPTSHEMEGFRKTGVRFLADYKKKKLYIWNLYTYHSNLVLQLIRNKHIPAGAADDQNPDYLRGIANVGSGKLKLEDITYSHIHQTDEEKEKEKDWSWLDKYFTKPVRPAEFEWKQKE